MIDPGEARRGGRPVRDALRIGPDRGGWDYGTEGGSVRYLRPVRAPFVRPGAVSAGGVRVSACPAPRVRAGVPFNATPRSLTRLVAARPHVLVGQTQESCHPAWTSGVSQGLVWANRRRTQGSCQRNGWPVGGLRGCACNANGGRCRRGRQAGRQAGRCRRGRRGGGRGGGTRRPRCARAPQRMASSSASRTIASGGCCASTDT